MKVCIFTGPTISAADARLELEATYLPPVSQGDVYRAALKHPSAIGIIDGYFERVPAVWHKEILWAMSRGIHVFGSASMGALRAAELHVFGMVGVGKIFEAFHRSELEDDDEVAVAHGPEDCGFLSVSEPMVNIRATLTAAESSGVISAPVRAALEKTAKSLYYPDRNYKKVIQCAREQSLPAGELKAFESWFPTGRVDQKREDAVAMLRAMRTLLENYPGPKRVNYLFERTHFWKRARRS